MTSGPRISSDIAVWLDVTRLVSRVGRAALTGVDRVERAYLDWLLMRDAEDRLFLRTGRGFLLLPMEAASTLIEALERPDQLGASDWLSRVTGKGGEIKHRIEAALRIQAVDRAPPWGVKSLLNRSRAARIVYLNVGHSNLSPRHLEAIAAEHDARAAILIHDMIPLDHPEFVVPAQAAAFERKMRVALGAADLLIANSAATAGRIRHYVAEWGLSEALVDVAHLGLPDQPALGSAPTQIDPSRPYLVSLGTIEPRKNHDLLLDVWEALASALDPAALPHLHIIGQRGWQSEAFFARLDAHPLKDKAIFEHGALSDADTRAVLSGAKALLFPSFAEGFGLPPAEALREGVLPVCADLPVLREILGNSAVYLDPKDAYSWVETIKKLLAGKVFAETDGPHALPKWPDHFEKVERAVTALWQDGQKGNG